MPYGFYTTNVGRKLITESIDTDSKIEITKACFGSGGDSSTERDYDISELNHQFYEKTLDTLTDGYRIDPNDPTQICITVLVPNEVEGTVNEIGFKDNSDNLIYYGIIRDRKKEAGTTGEVYQMMFENWIKIENSDTDRIEFKILSPEFVDMQNQITALEGRVQKLESMINSQ